MHELTDLERYMIEQRVPESIILDDDASPTLATRHI